MHFYFPRYRALCMAENATHNLHNLLTLRGALVRDPHGWSGYLTEAIDAFADRADVVFASHHWPTWGKDRIVEFLSLQRDLYAYLHDQTLRQLNQGYTGIEIAETFQMPPALRQGVAHPRLLRLGQPQRQGGLPALHGLVRRQPGAAVAASARGDRAALRRGHGRHRPCRRDRAEGLRRRRLPLGGNAVGSRHLHRREPCRRQDAVRRHPRAARLRRRERDVAQLLPLRCHRAARRQLRHADADRRRCR